MAYNITNTGMLGSIMSTANAAEARRREKNRQDLEMLKSGFGLTTEAEAVQKPSESSNFFKKVFGADAPASASDYKALDIHPVVAEQENWRLQRKNARELQKERIEAQTRLEQDRLFHDLEKHTNNWNQREAYNEEQIKIKRAHYKAIENEKVEANRLKAIGEHRLAVKAVFDMMDKDRQHYLNKLESLQGPEDFDRMLEQEAKAKQIFDDFMSKHTNFLERFFHDEPGELIEEVGEQTWFRGFAGIGNPEDKALRQQAKDLQNAYLKIREDFYEDLAQRRALKEEGHILRERRKDAMDFVVESFREEGWGVPPDLGYGVKTPGIGSTLGALLLGGMGGERKDAPSKQKLRGSTTTNESGPLKGKFKLGDGGGENKFSWAYDDDQMNARADTNVIVNNDNILDVTALEQEMLEISNEISSVNDKPPTSADLQNATESQRDKYLSLNEQLEAAKLKAGMPNFVNSDDLKSQQVDSVNEARSLIDETHLANNSDEKRALLEAATESLVDAEKTPIERIRDRLKEIEIERAGFLSDPAREQDLLEEEQALIAELDKYQSSQLGGEPMASGWMGPLGNKFSDLFGGSGSANDAFGSRTPMLGERSRNQALPIANKLSDLFGGGGR
jgi:hypothetical protein